MADFAILGRLLRLNEQAPSADPARFVACGYLKWKRTAISLVEG
jgi:hypothetical protein